MVKRIETLDDLIAISGTAAANLGKKPKKSTKPKLSKPSKTPEKLKPSKPSKVPEKPKPTEKKEDDYREDWIETISPYTGDTMRVNPNRIDDFLLMGWKKVKEKKFVAPKYKTLPPNTHLWYWAKKEPSNVAPHPSVNYYFRSLEMAQYVSDNFDDQHKYIHCYSITDITECQWWMVHFYNHDKPLEEIHNWCLENAKNYEAGSFWSDVKDISASKGFEKSINNFSEFKKQFTIEGKIDKKTKKEVWYVKEKRFDSGYGYQATTLDEKTGEWELRRCFESRTRRTYTTDDGKFALVVCNMDWTRFYHLNKLIPAEHGAWTCLDGDGYPGSVKILFSKKSRRDIALKALKQWYG